MFLTDQRVLEIIEQAQREVLSVDEPQRTDEMTHSEKLADQMVQDAGRLDASGRQRVRKELDRIDAPLTGRAAQDEAARQAIGKGLGLTDLGLTEPDEQPRYYEHCVGLLRRESLV